MKQRCRCCLATNPNTFFDIFEQHPSGTTLAENIRYIADVQIDQNDGLSQQICLDCYDEVQHIFNFCYKVRQADQKLRNELSVIESQVEDDQMENVQILDSEYFAPLDDNGMHVCVVEEMLEQDNDQENVIVEEIHDVGKVNIVDEISDSVMVQEVKSYKQKNNLLASLALIAANEESVDTDKHSCNDILPEDENDEDYLIEFDPNEMNNMKHQKWKCGECKVILRGDVSYEGHMNIHRQCRPHTCNQCNTSYRCRTALKRHKDFKHYLPIQNEKTTKHTILCLDCQKQFYSEITFCLHEAFVHCRGDKCPFNCKEPNESNLKQHLEYSHEKDIFCATKVFCFSDLNITNYQCFRCSEIFKESKLLQDHFKLCQTLNEEILQDNTAGNNSVIEILKEGEPGTSARNTAFRKRMTRRKLNKNLESHKHKEDTYKSYLCASCHNSFQNLNELDEHILLKNCKNSYKTYAQGNKNFADIRLLEKNKKEIHKAKCGFVCIECGNLFSGRAQLSAHKRLHRERPFKCDQCNKAYPRKVELEIHMRTHTGELPYECHLCEKRFAIKVRLTYHLQKHEGITHNCSYCSAVYDSRNKLKAHLFKHTGMPYKCEFCPGIGFERRLRFANHMKRVHQKILTEEELTQAFAKNIGKIVHFKTPTR